MVVTAPIIVGIEADDGMGASPPDRARVDVEAVEWLNRFGVVIIGRHDVGRGRLVLELAPDRADQPLDRSASHGGAAVAGAAVAGADLDVAEIVRQMRADGLAAVAGPLRPTFAGAWSRRNAPIWFAADACVCMPWSVFDRDDASVVVEIDPGRGFGSGGHPTTGLLLGRLAGHDLADRSVVDVGCGTGVLGIAAALLGATRIVALDTSSDAMDATEANAVRNGVRSRIDLVDADLAQLSDRFDVVMANIGASVLAELAPMLARLVAPGGVLMLSGISASQVSILVAKLAPELALAWRDENDGWVALGLT